jgi:hypothetical protein
VIFGTTKNLGKTTNFEKRRGLKKQLPIGVQQFSEMIRGEYLYVDKTEHLHRLIRGGKYYFLSRPRRFGKSLLVSTLKEIFEGNKDLFKGLWIYDQIDWEPRPVIVLDFTRISKRALDLEQAISRELIEMGSARGLTLQEQTNAGKLQELIQQLSVGGRVAILIDEYDKPILDHIDDPKKAEENRQTLKDLYSIIKGNDEKIAFFILTGVSIPIFIGISQVSIFSDLNNLYDITVDGEFSEMLGYTEQELHTYFDGYIKELNGAIGDLYPDIYAAIRKWYNGYSWDGEHFVYNPFSILNLMRKKLFQDYWFATGTPTFLMKLIRRENYSVFDLKNKELSLRAFYNSDVLNIEIKSLLFQTGYLTIKKLDPARQSVTLDFPNKEVESAFSFHLLAEFAEKSQEKTDSLMLQMSAELEKGHIEEFLETLKAMFAGIAYPIQPGQKSTIDEQEKYYHSIFYLVLKLLGYNIESEVLTSTGRIDAVITTPTTIYVIEFKLGDASSAMAQIKQKLYHQKYQASGKKLVLVGIGFDTKVRNIGEYLIAEV